MVHLSCGKGETLRYSTTNQSCKEVYFCESQGTFIELIWLCDMIESCKNEVNICIESTGIPATFDIAFVKTVDCAKIRTFYHSFCLVGFQQTSSQGFTDCQLLNFLPESYRFLGESLQTKLKVPRNKFDCSHIYMMRCICF